MSGTGVIPSTDSGTTSTKLRSVPLTSMVSVLAPGRSGMPQPGEPAAPPDPPLLCPAEPPLLCALVLLDVDWLVLAPLPGPAAVSLAPSHASAPSVVEIRPSGRR